YRVVEKISVLGGAAALFAEVYPKILALWEPLRGLLPPEYFWDRGFEPKDRRQMRVELIAARAKRSALETKYLYSTDTQKLAIERAYRAMLCELETLKAPNKAIQPIR